MKIAIASGKGGTGKTTLSVALSHYLAEKQSILLTDLDVEEPNSGLFLSGTTETKKDMFRYVPSWTPDNCKHCGQCQKLCEFNAIIRIKDQILTFPKLCHGCYACAELCPTGSLEMVPEKMGVLTVLKTDALPFVEGKLDVGQEQAVPLIAQTKEYVEENFKEAEHFLFDAPPGTSCPVIEAVKGVDYVILVTEPTPFGLHDLKLAVETMRALEIPFGVVINRYGTGNDEVDRYCADESISILGKIPYARKIAELYSRGERIDGLPEVREQLQKIAMETGLEGVQA